MSSSPDSGNQQRVVLRAGVDVGEQLAATGLERGQPVVVLVGGAAHLDEGGVDVAPLVREIVRVANDAGAVIIDGGTDAGVMALAGQAHRGLRAGAPLVGVAPLGRIAAPGVEGAAGLTELEPNHTHQLLAPGAEWGEELPWMLDAAEAIGSNKPVVGVLVDGGPLALTEATKMLAHGWPLVTVAGSGRAADDLAKVANPSIHVVQLERDEPSVGSVLRSLLTGSTEILAKIQFPALYQAAAAASRRGRSWFRLFTLVELGVAVLGIGVAIIAGLVLTKEKMEMAGDHTTLPTILAFALVGAFLITFVVKFVSRAAGYDDDWVIGRSVAEAVKKESWLYMMRVAPYDGEQADQRLEHELGQLLLRAKDIRQAVDMTGIGQTQISESMNRVRALNFAGRRQAYRELRIGDQESWYRRKSTDSRKWATRLFLGAAMLQLLAAVAAFMALHMVDSEDLGPFWLRVMAFMSSTAIALTAWSQTNRHDELAKAYAFTAQELALIAGSADRAQTEPELAKAVIDTEEAIGRENRSWLAKRVDSYESPDFGQTE